MSTIAAVPLTPLTRLTRDDYEDLVALPHGTTIQAGDTRLVMNREYPRPAFDDLTHGGYVWPHHVHDEYDVDYVHVEP